MSVNSDCYSDNCHWSKIKSTCKCGAGIACNAFCVSHLFLYVTNIHTHDVGKHFKKTLITRFLTIFLSFSSVFSLVCHFYSYKCSFWICFMVTTLQRLVFIIYSGLWTIEFIFLPEQLLYMHFFSCVRVILANVAIAACWFSLCIYLYTLVKKFPMFSFPSLIHLLCVEAVCIRFILFFSLSLILANNGNENSKLYLWKRKKNRRKRNLLNLWTTIVQRAEA